MGPLGARIVSGVALAIAFLAAAWIGGWLWTAMVAATAGLSVREWLRMTGGDAARQLTIGTALLIAALALSPLWIGAPLAFAGLALIAVVVAWAWRRQGLPDFWLVGLGVAYVGAAGLALVWLRGEPIWGRVAVLYLFAAVWANDTGAYAVGRWLRGPRLLAAISPSKTWAGLIGGGLAAALSGAVFADLFALNGWFGLVAGAVCLAMVATLGDLAESALKRRYKVKDSGQLIPGHGGMLDRIDGLMAAALLFAAMHALGFGDRQWG